MRTMLKSSLLIALFSAALWAAPKLRLATTTVGPVSIAAGASSSQVIEVWNAGDGALNLTFSSTETWATATAGASRACTTRTGTCIPVTVAFNATGLTAGIRTASVTLSDPNAWDAPQSITVVLQVGGPLASPATLVVPPGGTASTTFTTNGAATVTSDSAFLTVTLDSAGTFVFPRRYKITGRSSVTGEQLQNANITIAGGAAIENKTTRVTLRTTTQPILSWTPAETERIQYRVIQGAAPQKQYLAYKNVGLGTLTLGAVQVASVPTGWLKATVLAGAGLVEVVADPTGLAPGNYTGAITVGNNSANSLGLFNVALTVLPTTRPTVFAGQVLNNADYVPGDNVGQGAIVALKGEHFYTKGDNAYDTTWPRELGGIAVYVNGVSAPLYFANYNQINFQMPYETRAGEASVQVLRDGVGSNAVTVQVVERAPRIMDWRGVGATEYGLILFNNELAAPLPPAITIPGYSIRAAAAGDSMVMYAVGLGQTNPPAITGAPSTVDPLLRVPGTVQVIFGGGSGPLGSGGIPVRPDFVGLAPPFTGLYQINFTVPAGLTGSFVPVRLSINGVSSNSVLMQIR
ncbi:MAG: hypothetical protein NTZ56_06005 [Acidobacteria bacterium]|nr:hypothetical protein [Acidobacteriota bacterium]